MAAMKLALLVAFVGMALSCVVAAASDVETINFREYYSKGVESTVFGPAPTANSVQNFGKGEVYDFTVTIDDKEVGRSRGLYVHDTVDGSGGQELFTISFQSGEFSGSSLTFGGHWSDSATRNELAVTGGTGVFKFASGSAVYEDVDGSYYVAKASVKSLIKSFAGL